MYYEMLQNLDPKHFAQCDTLNIKHDILQIALL